MSKLRLNVTMSLDGYLAGPNQSEENPLGEGAGAKDVALGGGADVARQYLAAGLLDELQISVVPLLLGGGARLFDDLGAARPQLEQVRVTEAPGVAHLEYRVR